MDQDVKKIDTNNFEVTDTITRNVDKKVLKSEIEEIKKIIEEKKKSTGIDGLEKTLADKKELLALLK
jgi:hypothetical protein